MQSVLFYYMCYNIGAGVSYSCNLGVHYAETDQPAHPGNLIKVYTMGSMDS